MNALSMLGSNYQPQFFARSLAGDGQSRGLLQSPTTPDSGDVALSSAGRALAGQTLGDTSSLLQRASDFGSATIDAAKKFVAGFAQSLFGDAAKGMSVSFDTTSLSASSIFSSAVQHSESSIGTSDAAALRLEDAADFVGSGTITTADGQQFRFEVEVHYASTLEVSASSSSSSSSNSSPTSNAGHDRGNAVGDSNAVPRGHHHRQDAPRENLSADFPGSVSDLFKMFDQGSLQLPFRAKENGADDAASRLGSVTLRLLESLSNLESMAGKLARSYGDLPSSGKVAEQA